MLFYDLAIVVVYMIEYASIIFSLYNEKVGTFLRFNDNTKSERDMRAHCIVFHEVWGAGNIRHTFQ